MHAVPSCSCHKSYASQSRRNGTAIQSQTQHSHVDVFTVNAHAPRCCPLQYSSWPTDRNSFGCLAERAATSAAVHCRPLLPSTLSMLPPASQPRASACVSWRCLPVLSCCVWLFDLPPPVAACIGDPRCPSTRASLRATDAGNLDDDPSPAVGFAFAPPVLRPAPAARTSCALAGCGCAAAPGSCSPLPRVSPGAGGESPESMPPYLRQPDPVQSHILC